MSVIAYIIHEMIIKLQRINYRTFVIIQSQHMAKVYLICIIIINQSKQC